MYYGLEQLRCDLFYDLGIPAKESMGKRDVLAIAAQPRRMGEAWTDRGDGVALAPGKHQSSMSTDLYSGICTAHLGLEALIAS